ncbi:hypothetical protein GCM10020254_87830 [Streptomyces goshikiensis]
MQAQVEGNRESTCFFIETVQDPSQHVGFGRAGSRKREDALIWVRTFGLIAVEDADRWKGSGGVEIVMGVDFNSGVVSSHRVDLDFVQLDAAVTAKRGGDHEFGEVVLDEDCELGLNLSGDGPEGFDVELPWITLPCRAAQMALEGRGASASLECVVKMTWQDLRWATPIKYSTIR